MTRVVADRSWLPGEVIVSAASANATTSRRFLWVRSLNRITSEVELEDDLRKPRVQDLLRLLPAVERRVHAEHGIRVQRVVEIEADVEPRAAGTQNLADAEIELIQAFTIHRARFDEVHVDVARAAGERTPERGANLVRRGEVGRQNFRTRQVLKR